MRTPEPPILARLAGSGYCARGHRRVGGGRVSVHEAPLDASKFPRPYLPLPPAAAPSVRGFKSVVKGGHADGHDSPTRCPEVDPVGNALCEPRMSALKLP